VLFEGRDIHADLTAWRAQLGYIPEEAHLYTWMSAMEYLQLVGRLRGMRERLIQEKAEAMLALLGLESWRFSPMSVYSKGMRQRVLMAAALLHDPRMMVFDEPLSGLDVLSARLFRDLLRELAAAGKAVLYISHVLEIVEQLCDRVIVIAQGKIVADAPPGELTRLMELPTLEKVFAQLVRQQDTQAAARSMVEVMRSVHA
jgi:ABC-2 type transport system ATP-binding protein